MPLIVLGLLSLLVVAWAWVTQPLLFSVAGNSAVLVEPVRLEAHVRKLSEMFFPRDAGHPDWEAGYNAVMITDTAFYRNPNYHTWRDTADTLDYQRMAMVVQGVYTAVLAFAQ